MSIEQEEAVRREGMRIAVEGIKEIFRAQRAPAAGFQPRNDVSEIDDARDVLRESILETIHWRRDKAGQFPNDRRNVTAAVLLEAMVESVEAVPDTLIRQYGEAWDHQISVRTSEAQSVLLRDVGFRSTTADAAKLIEHLMDHVADFRADLRKP